MIKQQGTYLNNQDNRMECETESAGQHYEIEAFGSFGGGMANSLIHEEITNCDRTDPKTTVDAPHPLSAGKKYHLFVIHCNEDEDEVIKLVREIEQRFSIKCMLHQRDFQPGVGIPQNCQMKIDESEKVLVVLSPEYFQAYWCQEELKCAKMWSHELKRNDLIIPLILRPITDQMPPDLRYHTYINAMKEDDLAKRIYDAYLYDERAEAKEDLLKKNGFRLLEKTATILSPKTFFKKFTGISWSFTETSEGEEEVRDLYDKCAEKLNARKLLQCHGLLVMGIRVMLMTIAVTLMLALTLVGIHGSFVLCYHTDDLGSVGDLLKLAGYVVACIFFGIPIGLTLVRRKLLLEADRLVWRINRENKNYKCLALLPWGLMTKDRCIKLVIIRYDRTNCTKYLTSMLKRKHPNSDDEDIQKTASILVQNALFGAREQLLKWDTLKENSINHHNTWKSKECVCDMVAPMIEDANKDSVIITRGKVNSVFVTW